jgi:hypothetical protein
LLLLPLLLMLLLLLLLLLPYLLPLISLPVLPVKEEDFLTLRCTPCSMSAATLYLGARRGRLGSPRGSSGR